MTLIMHDGGSYSDELLITLTGNSMPSPVTSLGNQLFIIFTPDVNGVNKGYSTNITFGN